MSKELSPSRIAAQFVVRFPAGMRERITESAKSNGRSMNSEIVARLDTTFTGSADSSGTIAQLQEIAQAHKDTVKWLGQLNHALALSLKELASHVPQEVLCPGSAAQRSASMALDLVRRAQTAVQPGMTAEDSGD